MSSSGLSKKKKNSLIGKIRHMVLGKKVAIFDWEWGRNSAPRDGQKIPCNLMKFFDIFQKQGDFVLVRVYNQMKNLECYVPAIVEFLPEDQRHPHKFYSVLMFNGQRVYSFIIKSLT